MKQLIANPKMFAQWFNKVSPDEYHKVDAEDIQDMTQCGLIARHGYYLRDDLDTVRGILKWEQLQQNRQKRDEIKDSDGAKHCRLCRVVLIDKHKGQRGRPKEYCVDCEPKRPRDRNRKWWNRKKAASEC